jgi:hypothetical protein
MSFLKNLFGKPKPTEPCPRCLGKGHVDKEDIKRLKMELRWAPGPCAYCNGKGKVATGTQSKVAVDEAFLTTDIPKRMRKKLFAQDEKALETAKSFNENMENVIEQIIHLHAVEKMNALQIAEFYLSPEPPPFKQNAQYKRDKQEFVDYIKEVIDKKG